jgi:rhomboid protease GluP
MHDPLSVSAGASGAILGVYGSLLAFLYVHRDRYPRETLRYHAQLAAGLLVLSLIYGFIVPGIDNYAHAGGFVAGAFAGALLARKDVSEQRRAAYALPVMALLIILWALVVDNNFLRRGFPDYLGGLQSLRAKDYGKAETYFSRFIERNPDEVLAYGSRALARVQLGELPQAAQDFEMVIKLSPQSPEGYNSLAWVEDGLGKYDLAVAHATTSLQLDPRSVATYDTRGYALGKLGQTEKALADFARGLKYDAADSAIHYHRMKLYESLKRSTEAAQDKQAAAAYKLDPWERPN